MRHFIKIGLCIILGCLSWASRAEVLLQDIQGNNIPFTSLKGKWVLINYWASWCQTCIDEIPAFNQFHTLHKKDPVALFSVNFDALPLDEQKLLVRKFNINYPNLAVNPAEGLKLGDIVGVPMTFIFNPKGKLTKTLYGKQTLVSLNKAIGY